MNTNAYLQLLWHIVGVDVELSLVRAWDKAKAHEQVQQVPDSLGTKEYSLKRYDASWRLGSESFIGPATGIYTIQ